MPDYSDPVTIRKKRIAVAAAIATALAVPAEGLRRVAYYDPPGVLTVCYGSTTAVEKSKVYTLQECKARLDADMLNAIEQVERCAPGLPENVLAAFGDAVYNLGPKIACDKNNSTAARLLASGKLIEACQQLPRWDKAKVAGMMVSLPGLVKRREQERLMCMKELT